MAELNLREPDWPAERRRRHFQRELIRCVTASARLFSDVLRVAQGRQPRIFQDWGWPEKKEGFR